MKFLREFLLRQMGRQVAASRGERRVIRVTVPQPLSRDASVSALHHPRVPAAPRALSNAA